MALTRWTNPSLPQTLQIGMFLLYIDAAFGVILGRVLWFPIGTALVVGAAAAGIGIANEKRWGWTVGVAVSAASLALLWLSRGDNAMAFLITLAFPLAQFLLLVHPQSREHQKIWFS